MIFIPLLPVIKSDAVIPAVVIKPLAVKLLVVIKPVADIELLDIPVVYIVPATFKSLSGRTNTSRPSF